MNEIASRKISRRQMLRLLGITTAGVAVAACAPQAAPAPETPAAGAGAGEQPAPAAAGEVKIRYYINADPTRNKWAQDVLVPDYKALHPEVTVELIIVPWNEFDPKLTNMFAAGDLPEVWGNWGSTGYGEYVLRGMCIYEEDLIQRDMEELKLDDFPKSALDGVRIRGKLVGLPVYILGTYTYYNKDLFDQAGLPYPPSNWDDESWTWDRMVETAQKLTKNYDDPATGQYGVQTGFGPEDLTWLWDDDLWPPDATQTSVTKTINIDHPAVIEAYQTEADLVCKLKVAPDAAISQALSAAGDPFQAGKVAMNMSGGWGFWSLKEAEGTFRWGAGALPRVKPGVMKDALYADPMLISSQTKFKEEAWTFVKYIYSEEGLRKFTVATWSPPSRQSLLSDWTNLWPEDLRAELTESVRGSWKYGEVTPWNRIAGYSMFYDVLMAELGPARLCEKTVAEVAPTVKQRVEEILATLEFPA